MNQVYLAQQKVTASHLQRRAYLYIRQSSLHQVLENPESTARSTSCANGRLRSGGRANASWSLMGTRGSRAPPPRTVPAFNCW